VIEMGTVLQGVFAKNRAEELEKDVWKQFVVPHFYSRLDLTTARKPRIIVGGRGCGKTMLLRYLSYETMFSNQRPAVPDDAISHIGLYWRTDTHFMNLMKGRGIDDSKWHAAFSHIAAVELAREVLGSLGNMADSALSLINRTDLEQLDFSRLRAFDSSLPSTLVELSDYFEGLVWNVQSWVNDTNKAPEPRFLAGKDFLQALITVIKRALPALTAANFFVYIDEYENLAQYQKKIVNAWLKHSSTPLIFNLAMKRNAFDTQETTGPESLQDIHDYRIYDLEAEIKKDFSLFAAEILLLKLGLAGQNVPVNLDVLRDPERLVERATQSYRAGVIARAEFLFPGLSHREMANDVFASKPLSDNLRAKVKQALHSKGSQIDPNAFIRPHLPEASLITPALLNRKTVSPEHVLDELEKLESGKSNDFTGTRDLIHNNFVGSYLQLFEARSRPCPYYSGFSAFCLLSRNNLRHFLELCHQSINRVEDWQGETAVARLIQAEAARYASTAFLREIRSCGPHGLQLHAFALRLGSLFSISQQRPSQSEPEVTHFSIGDGTIQLEERDLEFLREAVKWSILYEEKETKQKDASDPSDTEYILDPIYAPYFHISYSKRRRVKLRSEEVIALIRGSYDQVRDLLRRYTKKWEVEEGDLAPTLFSHLGTE
jgi:hypothetical protein